MRTTRTSGIRRMLDSSTDMCCAPYLDCTLRNARAAGSSALIWCERCVAFYNADPINRYIEFFCDHLTHRYPEAGADVGLAGINSDRSVFMNRQEAVDLSSIQR